jgi:hypothetical protein
MLQVEANTCILSHLHLVDWNHKHMSTSPSGLLHGHPLDQDVALYTDFLDVASGSRRTSAASNITQQKCRYNLAFSALAPAPPCTNSTTAAALLLATPFSNGPIALSIYLAD